MTWMSEISPEARCRETRGWRFGAACPVWIVAAGLLLSSVSCRSDMQDQPRFEALEETSFFPDLSSARLPVPGTVARGQLRRNVHYYRGIVNGVPVRELPSEIAFSGELIRRGQERFEIFCSPCHGSSGYGDGIVVQRGLGAPPSFHIQRLLEEPVGHYFDVITNGLGAMYPYGSRIEPQDRWAIVAYVRALQLSQNASLTDLPEAVRKQLESE